MFDFARMMLVYKLCEKYKHKNLLLYSTVMLLIFGLYLEVVQQFFVRILSVKAGFDKVTRLTIPFLKTSVIEHLFAVLYDKWNYADAQALFEAYKSANSTVSVLKRMYFFKITMKFYYIIDRNTR